MPVALKLDKAILPKLPHHLLNDVMDQIRIFVENIIISSGVHGSAVPVYATLCWQLSPFYWHSLQNDSADSSLSPSFLRL